jgi:hypothetical protein
VHEMMSSSSVRLDTPLLPIMRIEMSSKRTIASRAEAKTSRSRGESSPAQSRSQLVHKQISLARYDQ